MALTLNISPRSENVIPVGKNQEVSFGPKMEAWYDGEENADLG